MFPIDEIQGEDHPLGASCVDATMRGRKVANCFIHEKKVYFILEPLMVLCIEKAAGEDAFLLKAGHASRSALAIPCNLHGTMVGRTFTDAKIYPDKLEIELDHGAAGLTLTFEYLLGWIRPKPPAIN